MTTTRKQYSRKFKARVALEAIRGERTLHQLASQFHVHPVQIGHWRKTAMEQLGELFLDGRKRMQRDGEVEKEALLEEIGRLKMELDWLKKKLVCSTEDRRSLVELGHPDLSIRRQCDPLGVNRASLYYQPLGESEENLLLMRLLEEPYTPTPFYGSRRMIPARRDGPRIGGESEAAGAADAVDGHRGHLPPSRRAGSARQAQGTRSIRTCWRVSK